MASERILGISLGTRKMGLAILQRGSIFDCGVKSFQGSWDEQKLQKIISVIKRYLIEYSITRIVIKVPTIPVPAPTITELLLHMQTLAYDYSIPFYTCTILELKQCMGLPTRTNKKEYMKRIVERYPELQPEYERELKSKIKHFEMMFEALGAARLEL